MVKIQGKGVSPRESGGLEIAGFKVTGDLTVHDLKN